VLSQNLKFPPQWRKFGCVAELKSPTEVQGVYFIVSQSTAAVHFPVKRRHIFYLTSGRHTSEDPDLCDVRFDMLPVLPKLHRVLHACKFCIFRDMKLVSWPGDRRRTVTRHTVRWELVADPHTQPDGNIATRVCSYQFALTAWRAFFCSLMISIPHGGFRKRALGLCLTAEDP
jgi:hypothetical protein